jgi:5-hydroxyisourate hydrolase-like protein (transthyretin family)
MKHHAIIRGLRVAAVAVAVALLLPSCEFINRVFNPTSDTTVTSELFKEVAVTVSGTVVEADSESPLAGMSVEVVEYDGGTTTTIGRATTDSAGEFQVLAVDESGAATGSTEIPLSVDTKEYRLSVTDSSEDAYFPNEGTVLYAVKDQALEYEVVLVPRNPVSETLVRGLVLDGVTRTTRLPGVSVTLTDSFDSSISYSTTTLQEDAATTTQEAGTFSVTVPVSSYRVTYDGSTLGDQYVVEHEDAVLKNTQTNDLGTHFIIPRIPDGEYRVVVQWKNDAENWYELGTYLDVISSDIPIVNTLGPTAGQVEIHPRFSLNPGTGFAKETPYWPTSIVPSGDRTFVTHLSPLEVTPAGKSTAATVIEIQRDTESGSNRTPIEVVTLHQESPVSSYPENLTYYYRFDGGSTRHYPIGVYNLVVELVGWAGPEAELYGIYGSEVQVKLYAGSEFQGAFDIGSFRPDQNESNKRTWDVLFIEAGFTAAGPSDPADLYLRPVPYFSTWPENERWGRPPFLSQMRYYDEAAMDSDGTDKLGEITSLYYDTDWGLFLGTTGKGVSTVWYNGSPAETVSAGTLASYSIADIANFQGELIVLAESSGDLDGAGGVDGTVRYVGDGNVLVPDTGTAPTDANAIYCNPTADPQRLVVAASDGLYLYYWSNTTGFTWEAVSTTGLAGVNVTDVSGPRGGSRDYARTVIADGKVFTYNWITDSFDEHAELAPPDGDGTLVRGGFYGYVDSLLPHDIFWGITDNDVIYTNHLETSVVGDPPTDLSYAYGSSVAVTIEPTDAFSSADVTTIYDIGTLATEGYGGQPVFGTDGGIFFAEYDEFAGSGTDPAATYFTIRPYPFAPTGLDVRAVTHTYETTFFGTTSNGVITTLGGLF